MGEGGGVIFFLRCLFSVMVSEPVLPSPPSDRGLLGEEEVNTMRFLEFLRRGGRCGITTVPAVAVGAHGCRSVVALVYASCVASCPGGRSLLSQVAEVGKYGESAGSRGAGLMQFAL